MTLTSEISLTHAAITHVKRELAKHKGMCGVRLGVKQVGCSGFGYVVELLAQANDDDYLFKIEEGVNVFVDPESYPYIKGTQLDYVRRGLNEAFEFNNPNATGMCGCGESFTVKE